VHPTLARARARQRLAEGAIPDIGRAALVFVETLHINLLQPRPPIRPGAITVATYSPTRLLDAPWVQRGGKSDAVMVSDRDSPDLMSMPHSGSGTADMGNGFGDGRGLIRLPVRIISKPVPRYTEDARAQKIEGEVIVDVLFRADGGIDVLGLVKCLGHGLNESAVEAVHSIRFRPASVNGRAVDFQGRVHVVFQLMPELPDAGAPS